MDPVHIFYSWQADREAKLCRDFIRRALDTAAGAIAAELAVPVLVDSDTSGVPGTPPVTQTILDKIDACDIFVADMSFIGRADSGKLLPNPNVMAEYGYARRAKGNERILLLMNTAFGPPEDLPFDLRHLRHPTRYEVPPGTGDPERRRTRDALALRLEGYLRAMIEPVLAERSIAAMLDDRRDAARDLITDLAARSARGDRPAVVSTPRLSVWLAPFAAIDGQPFDHGQVVALRPHFVPAGFPVDRWEPHSTADSWDCHGPVRRVEDRPNPECFWSTRIVRPGIFELVVTIGERIDDDPTIAVDGRKLEARILDAAGRLARLARDLGLDGPMLLRGGLEGLDDVDLLAAKTSRPLKRAIIPLCEVMVSDASALQPIVFKDMFDRLWLDAGFDAVSPSFQNGMWQGDIAPHLYALD